MSSTDTMEKNPRATIGGNNPPLPALIAEAGDTAQLVTDWLRDGPYAELTPMVAALVDEAQAIIDLGAIADAETKERVTTLIKKCRDQWNTAKAFHDKEAIPYARGKQAIDQFFFGLMDLLGRRDKTGKPGVGNSLGDMLTAYDTRLLAEERARRDAEARRLAEQEAKRRAEQEAAERAAREAADAAARARKPDTQQTKAEVADQRHVEAAGAKAAAEVAAAQADQAYIHSIEKPADIMRNRQQDGTLSTVSTEPYAMVEDESLLDKEKLWPFLKLDAKEAALRAWAKTTSHNQQMPGAKIGRRPKSVVR